MQKKTIRQMKRSYSEPNRLTVKPDARTSDCMDARAPTKRLDSSESSARPSLLIVDDDPRVRSSIKRCLRRKRWLILEASSGEEAKRILKDKPAGVVLADYKMGGMNGLEFLSWVKENMPGTVRVMLTAHSSVGLMREAINSGEVFRFITKPWENNDLLGVLESSVRHYKSLLRQQRQQTLEVENELTMKHLEHQLRNAWEQFHEQKVFLEESRIEVVEGLARAVDAKDPYTHGHMERVGQIARVLSERMDLPLEDCETIQLAGILHDVGKIGIPDNVLLHPGHLDDASWTLMKLHPEMGSKILDPIRLTSELRELIEAHHERYDGKGYPRGLAREEIPLGARIIAIADAFDAMAHKRRYRAAFTTEGIFKEIEANVGSQFDPHVGKVMLNVLRVGRSFHV